VSELHLIKSNESNKENVKSGFHLDLDLFWWWHKNIMASKKDADDDVGIF
jgi:hypothetical protein